jgi:hypothetical protein
MALEQTIDRAVQEFESSFSDAQDQFIQDVEELQAQGLSLEEILAILAGISMLDYYLVDLQMQRAITRLMGSFDTLLDDAIFFGNVTERQLQALRQVQEASILKFTDDLATRSRAVLVQGVLRDLDRSALKDLLQRDLLVRPQQVNTIIETSLATYSRSLTLLQLQENPQQKLIYQNPLDSKTRPVCIRMLKEGAMTADQIEAKYPGALLDGGGINCRGQWVPLSPNTQNREIRKKAQVASLMHWDRT